MTSDIPFKDIRVLSFDIYGTLIDWESGIYSSLQSSPLGPYLPTTRQQTVEDFEDLEKTVQRESPSLRQSQLNAECIRRYARQLQGHSLSDEEVDKAAIKFGDSIGSWTAFPDTVEAMKKLQTRFKLVPLSNIDNETFARTLAGPLKGCHFDAIYTAEDIGSYKPDPRNFEYLLEHVKQDFGIEKDQLCHVAQSLYHDHAAIQPFGVTSVWVDRKGFMGARAVGEQKQVSADEYGYQLRVESLGELADIVDKAAA